MSGSRGNMRRPRLSVVAIFHDMRREAARTLYSLTSHYQRDISPDQYEVIAIDSTSTMPLDRSFVESFGPQFRYCSVNWEHPSPCKALNKGVDEARYEIVVCLIDGARILSPGIFAKMLGAFREFANPFVYTLAMHLGPKVQNESLLDGYCQEVEDAMLQRIAWEQNGYSLFSVSSVALSSKQGFYSALTESNCFSLFKSAYWEIGGYDENFISPGGGAANLDFFNRAVERESIQPVMLLGEASFHQYHGGVATNVPMSEHPWMRFCDEYRRLRGREYASVVREPAYFGQMVPEAEDLARLASF